jgi:hypothetical protein
VAKWKGKDVSKKRYFDLSRGKKRSDDLKFSNRVGLHPEAYRRLAEMMKEGTNV